MSVCPDQIPRFRHYFSFTGGPFLRDVLEGELGARSARPLYCSVDADAYRPAAPRDAFAASIAYMGTYSEDRQPKLDSLLLSPARRLQDHTFLVVGPQYPNSIPWPVNVLRVEHLPPADHTAFYSSSAWQLNVTRADMCLAGWSPPVRLFEAAACGASIISDHWPGIDRLVVEGREILVADGTADVLRILRESDPTERVALGRAARERILGVHTAAIRAAELERELAS